MITTTMIETDAPIPDELSHPLNRFAVACAVTGKKTCDENEVRTFLTDAYSTEMADLFRPEYLIPVQL